MAFAFLHFWTHFLAWLGSSATWRLPSENQSATPQSNQPKDVWSIKVLLPGFYD